MERRVRLKDIFNQRLRDEAVHMRAGRDDVVQADLVFNDNQRANLAPGHMFQREDHFVDDQLGIALLRNPSKTLLLPSSSKMRRISD